MEETMRERSNSRRGTKVSLYWYCRFRVGRSRYSTVLSWCRVCKMMRVPNWGPGLPRTRRELIVPYLGRSCTWREEDNYPLEAGSQENSVRRGWLELICCAAHARPYVAAYCQKSWHTYSVAHGQNMHTGSWRRKRRDGTRFE